MTSFETKTFKFLTFDEENPIHKEALNHLIKDPKVNRYLHSISTFLEAEESSEILDNAYLVAKEDDIVGYLCLFDYGKIEEMHYAVIDKYRGMRDNSNETIGARIVKETTESLFEAYRKIQYFRLFIESSNVQSIKTAIRAGFKLTERYFDGDEYRKYAPRK